MATLRGIFVAGSASNVQSLLESARAYAQANNTYVFVGLTEVDTTQAFLISSPSTGAGHTGRVVVAVVASRDGSNNFDASGNWVGNGNLIALSGLRHFDNVHLADFSGLSTSSGPMAARQTITASGSLGNSGVGATALITWPLTGSSPQYSFSKVIQFNPQGTASLENGTTPNGVPGWMEIALQPVNGNAAPAAVNDVSKGDIAAVQIDGVTGTINTYQP